MKARSIHKARGAQSNPTGRYEATDIEHFDDGWSNVEPLPLIRTHARVEQARSALTRNASSDLGFDRSINPYRGCEHGCIYCYARTTHAYLNMSPGLDFETKLIMRPGIDRVLEAELGRKSYNVAPIAIGTNTDPYQPIERDAKIMRAILEVLERWQHPVTITTKGALILRDVDILSRMAQKNLVQVGISVTTLDAELSRQMEPRAAAPQTRLRVISALSTASIPVRVVVAPLIPGLTDHELEALLSSGAENGASAATYIMLRLPGEVDELWWDWLKLHHPNRCNKVEARLRELHGGEIYNAEFGTRMRGTGPIAQLISQRFKTTCKRLKLERHLPELATELFCKPLGSADQPALF